jgi:uncharacterized protein (DUF736 family)
VMPWFRVHLRGVDVGRSWFATNEDEVLQNFVRIKGADLKKEAEKLGLDAAQYQKDYIRIVRERD